MKTEQVETKTPAELSNKQLEAFQKLMKASMKSPTSITAAHNILKEIYKTKKSMKDTLELFNKSPDIPLDIKGQKVVNALADYEVN